MNHAARTELFPEIRVLRVKVAFGLFLGVEMIEITEELIKAMIGRQILVMITQMILPKLAGRITLRFQHISDGGHPRRDAMGVTRHTDREQASTKWLLTEDERRPTRRAALLSIGIREHRAFAGDAVDVRSMIAHQTHRICADLWDADVVAKNNKDVRLLLLSGCRRYSKQPKQSEPDGPDHAHCLFPPVLAARGPKYNREYSPV